MTVRPVRPVRPVRRGAPPRAAAALAGAALAAAALTAALAAPVRAQTPAAPAPPPVAAGDSARPESVERLIALAYPEATHAQLVEQMIGAMSRGNPVLQQAGPAMRAFFAKHMSYAELRADQARVYRETYTEGEVQELARFYASDVGRRIVAKMPTMSARSQELAARRMQAHLPELLSLLQTQMGGRP
jgi:hypothetical protein